MLSAVMESSLSHYELVIENNTELHMEINQAVLSLCAQGYSGGVASVSCVNWLREQTIKGLFVDLILSTF